MSQTLAAADIPWPPCMPPGTSLLAAMAATEAAGCQALPLTPIPDPAALRRAFRRAALRWHPDRFGRRIAPRLPDRERSAAAARVSELAQQVRCVGPRPYAYTTLHLTLYTTLTLGLHISESAYAPA